MWYFVVMWMSLWAMGTILILKSKANAISLWGGIMMLAVGFGSFSLSIPMVIVPLLKETIGVTALALDALFWLAVGSAYLNWFVAPYVFLVSALHFNRFRVSGRIYALCQRKERSNQAA